MKFSKTPPEELPSSKYLLLCIVRLIHANPMLMLHVSKIVSCKLTVGICASLSLQLCSLANLARVKHLDTGIKLNILKSINFILKSINFIN